jgi:hemoglobin
VTQERALSVYEQVGGRETFERLANEFYDRVDRDDVLRPLFVEESLELPKRRLALFLMMYFGGPQQYLLERGHPRLRMRHLPFSIGPEERDAWVENMLEAIDAVGIPEPARAEMRRYFQDAATFLMNRTV